MGLIRIVIQKPEGEPFPGIDVALRRTEPQVASEGQATTDQEGAVRFWVEPGTFKVQLDRLPEGTLPSSYGTTVRLQDFAEGIEQVVHLVSPN